MNLKKKKNLKCIMELNFKVFLSDIPNFSFDMSVRHTQLFIRHGHHAHNETCFFS